MIIPFILNLLLKNVRLVIILVKLTEMAKSSFVKIVVILTMLILRLLGQFYEELT